MRWRCGRHGCRAAAGIKPTGSASGNHDGIDIMAVERIGATEAGAITATVKQFKQLSGLGATHIYALIKSGDLSSVTIGRRRLIVLDSYRALLDRQLHAVDRQ